MRIDAVWFAECRASLGDAVAHYGDEGDRAVVRVVHVTDGAAGALISVKIAGVFQDVVLLDAHHEVSVADMIAAGHRVV